jgi:hypothetical protein
MIMSNDDIKPGEQLTLAQINRLRKDAQAAAAGVGNQKKADDDYVETDPLKMKVDDLKAWLTGKGIEFPADAKKDDLKALVPAE